MAGNGAFKSRGITYIRFVSAYLQKMFSFLNSFYFLTSTRRYAQRFEEQDGSCEWNWKVTIKLF
jgi:hypothetical protein